MLLRKLNQPLTVKSALVAIGILLLGAAAYFGGQALWQRLDSGPMSPAQVKRQIWSFLKKQAKRSDFQKSAYDFELKQRVALMQTNLALFRQETAGLQTNLTVAVAELRRLRGEGQKLQEQQRTLAQAARRVEETLADKQLRWTNLLKNLSLAQSNVVRAETNLAATTRTTEDLQAAAQGLTNVISGLLTNIADQTVLVGAARTNLAGAQGEARGKSRDLAARQQALKTLQTDLAAKQQRLEKQTNNLNLTVAVMVGLAGTLRLEDELARLQTNLTNLSQEATNRLEKLTTVQGGLAALQKELSSKQQELAATRRKLADKRSALADRQRALNGARGSVGLSETNVATLQSNLAAVQSQLADKRAAVQAQQQSCATNAASVAAGQKAVERLQEQLQARQKELAERQRALQTSEQQLRSQLATFRTEVRQRVSQASSYENIYHVIGQQLYVAERLLASRDPIEPQQGLSLAVEASQNALQGAEQPWLAARICEAYLLPNLALADDKGRIGYAPDSLLGHCNSVFGQAEELPNVVRVLRMSLDRIATNAPARLDAVRYNLGYALERAGQYDEALDLYRKIQDTNYLQSADQRIAAVHALKAEKKAPRKQP